MQTIERHGVTQILPDYGETLLVRTDYEPWFLGFCRWTVRRLVGQGGFAYTTTLRSGRWRWRGRGAPCIDTLVEGP